MKTRLKILTFFIVLFITLNASANFFRIGAKYGYAYIDDYDKGKSYSALLNIPISYEFDVEIEYCKYEDDDGFVDGNYMGAFVGWNFGGSPVSIKVGYVKNEFDIEEMRDETSFKESFDDSEFAYGISTGVNLPVLSGQIEYLKVSDDMHTITLRFLF